MPSRYALPVRPALFTVALLAALSLSACMTGPRFANLEAQVVPDEPLDLPPNAQLSVRLEDMSSSGASLIAEANYIRLGRGPIPVMLRYDAKAIDEDDSYVLRADIRADGKLVYTSPEPVPVLTGDAPMTDVSVPVERIAR